MEIRVLNLFHSLETFENHHLQFYLRANQMSHPECNCKKENTLITQNQDMYGRLIL